MHAVLGEAHANGVTDAVGEERTDADRTLDASVLPVARLGHPEVDGVIPVGSFGVESRHEEAVGGDHDLRVRGLHREDEVVVAEFAGDAGELERALHHAERRVAEAVHDAVAQRPVVRADAHGDAAGAAKLDKGREFVPDTSDLRRVLLVRVFADGELLRVRVVPGVNPDFLDPFRRFQGGLGLEVDVGDKRNLATEGPQLVTDGLQVAGVLHRRRRDAHDFAPGLDQREGVPDAGGGVHGVAREHGLHADPVRAAEADRADLDLAGDATVRKKRRGGRAGHGCAAGAAGAGENLSSVGGGWATCRHGRSSTS